MSDCNHWIANRMSLFDASGIRKVFELGAQLKNPINLSIGQPDFDVPDPIKEAAIQAIREGKNGYSVTQGIAELRERVQTEIQKRYRHPDREVFVTSGTSGGLMLAVLTLVNPGDEAIIFDPSFVMYQALVHVAGGRPVLVDTYPDFRIDPDRVAEAITPRTKLIILNSPANPTGVVATEAEIRALAELAEKHGVALVSDEIYREYCYDSPFVSPAQFNSATIVIEGLSKSHGMPGWRIGFAHGPRAIMQQMIKLQQYSFVCAPHPLQWAAVAAFDYDMQPYLANYRRKRDMIVQGLRDYYELTPPSGAFYAFPKVPWSSATEFVTQAIEKHQLLIIPGQVFSRRDTHFRISFAAADETISRGIDILQQMSKHRP